MNALSDFRLIAAKARDRLERTQRRRRFVESIRPSDVFLVAYPKSGTTWLGFMLANVINAAQEELNLRNAWDIVPDINGSYFGDGNLDRYEHLSDPRFFLVHSPYDPALKRVVYIMRDPRDVMVSYYHYKRATVPNWNLPLSNFLLQRQQWPCSWEDHVRGWLEHQRNGQFIVVRYEEMHRDATSVLQRVLGHSGASFLSSDIDRALAMSKFERMRALEETFGVEGTKYAGERFVRKGQIGAWRNELGPADQNILQAVYGDLAREFGFETLVSEPSPLVEVHESRR